MKRFALIAAALVLSCGMALADGGQPLGTRGGDGVGVWVGDGGANPANYIKNVDAIVGLTDAQKQSITDIYAQRAKDVSNFNTTNADKLKAAGKEISDAYKSGDQDAIAKAQGDYQAAYAPLQDILKKYSGQLDRVLTSVQTAKLKDYRLTQVIDRIANGAKLTDQQMKAVKAAADPDNPTGSWQAIRDAIENVATPEQKAGMAAGRMTESVRTRYWNAQLTADQLKQVSAAAAKLVNDDSLSAQEKASKLNVATEALLTADQKAAMDKTHPGFKWGGEVGGGQSAQNPALVPHNP